MNNYQTSEIDIYDDDILTNLQLQNIRPLLKLDMEIKLYDIDINDDDTIDLAQKIENYGRDEFLFKDDDRQYKQKAPINNFKRLIDKKAFIDFKGPIQPRQVSTIFSLEISSHDSKQPEIQHRKRG